MNDHFEDGLEELKAIYVDEDIFDFPLANLIKEHFTKTKYFYIAKHLRLIIVNDLEHVKI